MVETARGISPTHADSHHHMHIYPAAAVPFARALAAEGIRCARAARMSVWPKSGEIGGPHEGSTARRALVQTYRAALQLGVFRALDMPQSRISFLSRDRHDLDALGERWKTAFAALPPGTFELACHPGLFERGFSESDPIRLQREEELHWLTGREWIELLAHSSIELITYRELSPPTRCRANPRPACPRCLHRLRSPPNPMRILFYVSPSPPSSTSISAIRSCCVSDSSARAPQLLFAPLSIL